MSVPLKVGRTAPMFVLTITIKVDKMGGELTGWQTRLRTSRCYTTLNEAYDLSDMLNQEGKEVVIFMAPPVEGEYTDEESAGEDETNEQLPFVSNFSKNILQAQAEVVIPSTCDAIPSTSHDTPSPNLLERKGKQRRKELMKMKIKTIQIKVNLKVVNIVKGKHSTKQEYKIR